MNGHPLCCPAERGVTGCKPPTAAIRQRSPGSRLAEGCKLGRPTRGARYRRRVGRWPAVGAWSAWPEMGQAVLDGSLTARCRTLAFAKQGGTAKGEPLSSLWAKGVCCMLHLLHRGQHRNGQQVREGDDALVGHLFQGEQDEFAHALY